VTNATVRDAVANDAAAIARIYNHYVSETVITFETEPIAQGDVVARIAKVTAAGLPYLVAEDPLLAVDYPADAVLGFAYASPFQERAAYRHSIETTVYLASGTRGRGIGSLLYAELLGRLGALTGAQSEHAPVHRLYARIALPNNASVSLHEKFGFERVATLSEVGFKLDRWIDVGFWERASSSE
jgi:phosphinothricin acetyltransferase